MTSSISSASTPSPLQTSHLYIDAISVSLMKLAATPPDLLLTIEKTRSFKIVGPNIRAVEKMIRKLSKGTSAEDRACIWGRFNALNAIYFQVGLAVLEAHQASTVSWLPSCFKRQSR